MDVAGRVALLLRSKSEPTKRVYLFEITKFLEEAGLKDQYSEWDLHRFFQKMEKKGYSLSYRQNALYALKLFFRALNQEFPLSTKDFARVDEKRQIPIMAPSQIEILIRIVKDKGGQEEKAYLALSSTYGMRVGEMAKLRRQDIDKARQKILVRTEKGGRQREHIIPEEIAPYVLTFPFKEVPETSLNLLFRKICCLAGIPRRKRQAWHSVRHSLVTYLRMRESDTAIIANFMRWKNTAGITGFAKQASWQRMLDHYTDYEDEEVDKKIFQIHPFLPFFRD